MSFATSPSPAPSSVISDDQALEHAIRCIRVLCQEGGTINISTNGKQFAVWDVADSGQRGSYEAHFRPVMSVDVRDLSTGLTQTVTDAVVCTFVEVQGSIKNKDGTMVQDSDGTKKRHVESLTRSVPGIWSVLNDTHHRVRSIIAEMRNKDWFKQALADPESKETVLYLISQEPRSVDEFRSRLENLHEPRITELGDVTDTEDDGEDNADDASANEGHADDDGAGEADEEPVKDV